MREGKKARGVGEEPQHHYNMLQHKTRAARCETWGLVTSSSPSAGKGDAALAEG
jgi:hypothetical protein